MSTHATADLLSAYLDRQLVDPEARQLEEHLESCNRCHVKLEGLRRVVANLQGLDPVAPPDGLQQAVARRIALADDTPSVLDRFEQGMSIFNRQSPILAMFGVVIALALFIYLFSYALHLRETSTTPVIFEDPPTVASTADQAAVGSRLVIAGRQLAWSEQGLWVEEGVSPAEVSRTLAIDSDAGRAFLAEHPDLADLATVDRGVIVEVGGEVVRLD